MPGIIIFCFFSIVLGLFDGHPIGVLLLSAITIFLASYFCNKSSGQSRHYAYKTFGIVSTVYLLSSYLASWGYHSQNHQLFIDCFGYIENLSLTSLDSNFISLIGLGYLDLQDLNVLHEIGYRLFIIFSNTTLDGASIFTLTYLHTLFGILSSCLLYNILILYVSPFKSYKYVLLFAFLSPFFGYSVVILRDIIIAFLYLLAFNIILREFSIRGLISLFIILLLALGFRLYSGLFISSFIFYYCLKKFEGTNHSKILIIIFLSISIALIGIYLLNSDIFQQSSEELTGYVEYDTDRAAGFTAKLSQLPSGIKEIVLSMYSQANPFPFYDIFNYAINIPLSFICLLRASSALWWYFIFYSLCVSLFVYKNVNKFSFSSIILLCIIATYIILNSVQIDVRRIMAIYPLIYIFQIQCFEFYSSRKTQLNVYKSLGCLYFFLLLVYIVFIQH